MRGNHWKVTLTLLAVVTILATIRSTKAAEPVGESVLIRDVPHVRQKPDFCGEACVEMWLAKLGQPGDQDLVFDNSGLDPLLGRGCYTRDLATAVKRLGFDLGSVWAKIPADSPRELNGAFAGMIKDLHAGVPSIVCMRYDERPKTTEHFRLILGYDADAEEVIYHEPAVADGSYRRMKREQFLSLWPLKYQADAHTLIRIPLKGNIKTDAAAVQFTAADFAQHVRKLKAKLPSDDFHIVLQPPFVVAGDESLDMVKRRSAGTVKWAVDHLKKDYFARNPEQIITVWLFKDAKSYNGNAKTLFQSKPSTPYGYYSPRDRALVMNISTGGGTLVHEIVHPFMASNFTACPAWFNEGLASLYEQSRENRGHIWGSTNWRLAGLQRAIAADRLGTFETLCSTTTREFYDDKHGTNYAQARYLCYYLQEQGKLVDFYHQFRRNAADDPTGYATLKAVLGVNDMEKFQADWEAYTAKLVYR